MRKNFDMSSTLTPAKASGFQDFEFYNGHVQSSSYNDRTVTVEKMKDAYFLGSELFKATLL